MAIGIDRNGTLSPTNYLFGGGPVYVTPLTSGNDPEGAFQEFGCVTEMSVNLSSTTYDHFCPRNGSNVRDMQAIQTVSADFSMSVDDFKFENVDLWSLGSITPVVTPALGTLTTAGVAQVFIPNPNYTGTAITDNRPFARHYELHMNSDGTIMHFGDDPTDTTPPFIHSTETRIRSTSGDSFAVTSITADGTAYACDGTVAGLTYDSEMSKLYIAGEDFLDSDLATDILAEAALLTASDPYIELTAQITGAIAERTIDRVISLTGTSRAVMIKYEGYNTESGQRVIVTLPRVKLIPQGQMGIINTQQVGSLPFAGSLEPNLEYTDQNGGYFHIEVV